jgi:hypothetical protein
MPRPPRLTDVQKQRLHNLEPRLHHAVKMGNYPLATTIAMDIQNLLRTTGHETRLMQSKSWLFEAALETGEFETAEAGFHGIRGKTSKNTRIHLEATALLAICLLRQGKIKKAEPYMAEVLKNDRVITSKTRRAEFRQHIISRFEEEAVLSSLISRSVGEPLDPKHIQEEAGKLLLRNASDNELFEAIGQASPPETIAIILKIQAFARKELPHVRILFLPSAEDKRRSVKVGVTVFEALKRRLYATVCDQNSDLYKAWFTQGLGVVLNKLYIGGAVTTLLIDMSAGTKALAIPVAAFLLKFGVEVFCEKHKPRDIMLR